MDSGFFLYPQGSPAGEQLPARVVNGRVYVAHLRHVVALADPAALDFLECVAEWDDESRALIRTLPDAYMAAFLDCRPARVLASDVGRLPPPPAARNVTLGGVQVDMEGVVKDVFGGGKPAAKK